MSSLPASMKKIRSKLKALECSQYFPHYNPMGAIRCINFSDAQGQITLELVVVSGRNLNSSEMLLISLPASMKKIRSKMRALECSQHFPHYIPKGAIGCHGHQSSDPIWSKT